jgi:hypothetical protein
MDDYVKIQVPPIIDDPISGRCAVSSPMFFRFDYVIIKNGRIGYKHAFESNPKKIIKITDIEKILVSKRNVSCWTSDFRIDYWSRNGTEVEISLVYKNGEKYVLIPNFLIRSLGKDWNWFLKELSDSTDIPVEDILERQKK